MNVCLIAFSQGFRPQQKIVRDNQVRAQGIARMALVLLIGRKWNGLLVFQLTSF